MGRKPYAASNASSAASLSSHAQELDPTYRKYLAQSLDRNDLELVALEKLHVSLRDIKSKLIAQHGNGNEDFILFPPTKTQDQNNSNEGDDVVKKEEVASETEAPQATESSSSPSPSPLVEEFHLRMKLRRKILNRLARRLNRLSHMMDGENVNPPPNPKYGDMRFVLNDRKRDEHLETKMKRLEALKELQFRKAKYLEEQQEGLDGAKQVVVPYYCNVKTEDIEEALIEHTVQYEHTSKEEEEGEGLNPTSNRSGETTNDDITSPPETTATATTATASLLPEHAAIKYGAGIGAVHRSMSAKEKELEWKRWQNDIIARVPDQPTFEELGMGGDFMFYEKQRRDRLLKSQQNVVKEEEGGDDDGDKAQLDEEGKKDDKDDVDMSEDESDQEKKQVDEDVKGDVDMSEDESEQEKKPVLQKKKKKRKKKKEKKDIDWGDDSTQSDSTDTESEVSDTESESQTESQSLDKLENKDSDTDDDDMDTEDESDKDTVKSSTSDDNNVKSEDNTESSKPGTELIISDDTSKSPTPTETDSNTQDDTTPTNKLINTPIIHPQKKKKFSLHPIPSFHNQDLRRLRAIQADLMYISLSEHIRLRLKESTDEYNASLKACNDMNNRKLRLNSDLHKMMVSNRTQLHKQKRDYRLEHAIAKAKYLRKKDTWEKERIKRNQMMLPQQHTQQQHHPNHQQQQQQQKQSQNLIRVGVESTVKSLVEQVEHRIANAGMSTASIYGPCPSQATRFALANGDTTRAVVTTTLQDILHGVVARATTPFQTSSYRVPQHTTTTKLGENHNYDTFEPFIPPPSPDLEEDDQSADILTRKHKEEENALRAEIYNVSHNLQSLEEDRKKAWRKMLKTKQELEPTTQTKKANYVDMALPPLRNGAFLPSNVIPTQINNSNMEDYNPPVPVGKKRGPKPGQPKKHHPQGSHNHNHNPNGDDSMNNTESKQDSKYSQDKIKARIFPDGSVMPVSMPKRNKDGLFQRPAGRKRKGMDWDAVQGRWIPTGEGGGGG